MLKRSILLPGLCLALLAGCHGSGPDAQKAAKRGQVIYAKECAHCHGAGGEGGVAAQGVTPPGLVTLAARNGGVFPYEDVRRFVMGVARAEDRNAAMPEFASVGLRHVYPKGGADGEVLEGDFEDLLSYLEAIQG
jgi:mono/diheme cytochrome c family protein